jgi:hypothetical protein
MRWMMLLMLLGSACAVTAQTGLPESVALEVKDRAALPSGTYTLARAWEAEATGHMTGRVVADPEAGDGRAVEATPGADEPHALLYGPYIELEPGDYVAFFRLKLMEAPEDDAAGSLDACVAFGQEMLGGWELSAGDLTDGRYVQVPLGFHYEQGQLECRVNWSGALGLRVDRVSLFRLTGRSTALQLGRVPEAVPSGEPKNLPYYTEPRPFPDVFPRSAPPAKTLLVCDLRKERTDTRLAILALQGLVNRTQPRLYCLSTPTDPQWLEHMQRRGWVEGTEEVAASDLVTRFRDVYRGLVVTDPYLPASKNVATMVGSVEDALPASPRLAKQLDAPVIEDLRGRWETSAEAYRWAFDHLWPRLNHHVIACSWPDHLALRDYLVQNRVFIFWLSGALDGAREYASPDAEVRLMEELLAQMPVNIPVLSYPYAAKDVGIGEGPGVSLFAEFGKYLVGTIDTANLSVHSGIRTAPLRQKPAPPKPPLDDDKVYFSFILSDGDNLPVLTNGNFPQLWADETRGSFPVGWTLSPSASVLMPDVVDYYYSTATENDDFLGAVSGVGYTYPDLYGKRYREPARRRIYDGFLAQTGAYLRRADLTQCWIMNATQPDVIARYPQQIPFLDALFPDYGRRVTSGRDATYPSARNMPVFHAVTGWKMVATREERIRDMVDDLRRMTPPERPAFLHAFALNWFTDLPLLQEVVAQLGPEYVAVRPDHLAALWREAMAREQVLVQLPEVAAGIEGLDLALTGSVRNMAGDTVSLSLSAEGLDGSGLSRDSARLEPAQEASFTLRGAPTGERVAVTAAGEFGTRRAKVQLRRIARNEVLGQLPSGTLTPSRYLEAESLSHRFGEAQADPEASGGAIWVARRGETEPGHIVFGPYAALEPGRYLALFRVRRLSEGTGPLALLDTCVAGGLTQTGQGELRAEELPLNADRWAPILFEHPGGNFETRVQWLGAASMAVDAIVLWKVSEPHR